MSLRVRLILAFAWLTLLPTSLLGFAALQSVNQTFDTISQRQLESAETAAGVSIANSERELRRLLYDLTKAGSRLEKLARSLEYGEADLPSLVPLASRLRPQLPYRFLTLLDRQGLTLSSAQLPGSFGVPFPELVAACDDHPRGEIVTALLPISWQEQGAIVQSLSWVAIAGLASEAGRRPSLYVAVGRPVDEELARTIRDASAAAVGITLSKGNSSQPIASATLAEARPPPNPWLSRLASLGERSLSREIFLGGQSDPNRLALRLTVSAAPLVDSRARIILAIFFGGGLALILALVFGHLLAKRMSRPLAELASAALALGRGEEPPTLHGGPGEIGVLVQSFETMRHELRRSQERIATAERVAAWREIARRLAHEIKNPLTPISTAIQTLRRAKARAHPDFDEIFEESTAAIGEEVLALREIVDSFARFARLPAPSPEPCHLKGLIEQATGLFPELPMGIELTRVVPKELEQLRVEVDRAQIQQILLNLVTNALQSFETNASPSTETRAKRIEIGARREDERIVVWVEDTGPGIPLKNQSLIFTPYFTTKTNGTGLGLAICHRIASEHRGSLQLSRSDEAGTRFELELPLALNS